MIIVLNGVPRSGKSSIAVALVAAGEGEWVNLGVDSVIAATDPSLWPGIGLRPGGERPGLEPFVLSSYIGLFDEVAERARDGVNVAMDVGIHGDYSQPLNIFGEMQQRFDGLPALLVGVHCPLHVLRQRRLDTNYLSWEIDELVPDPVQRWQDSVHEGKTYDLELDTSTLTPNDCAKAILAVFHRSARAGVRRTW